MDSTITLPRVTKHDHERVLALQVSVPLPVTSSTNNRGSNERHMAQRPSCCNEPLVGFEGGFSLKRLEIEVDASSLGGGLSCGHHERCNSKSAGLMRGAFLLNSAFPYSTT
eukprot:4774930-Amphidinium_carterae.1